MKKASKLSVVILFATLPIAAYAQSESACKADVDDSASALVAFSHAMPPSIITTGDGAGGTHSLGDDFKCSVLRNYSSCACQDSLGYFTARDFTSPRTLTGRVLDEKTGLPVVLAPGQWLEVKTAQTGGSYDTQRVGARVDGNGNFTLQNLECDKVDLRVRVNTGAASPGSENVNPAYGGRAPLAATIDAAKLIDDGYPGSRVFRLEKTHGPITVRVGSELRHTGGTP